MNLTIDPVAVGLQSHFTQSQGSVIESGNYFRPGQATDLQYGWLGLSKNLPSITMPSHLTAEPGAEIAEYGHMPTPPSPGGPNGVPVYYGVDEPITDYQPGLFAGFVTFIKGIIDKILSMFGVTTEWSKLPSTEVTDGAVDNSTATQGAQQQQYYTTSPSKMPYEQLGHTTIFSRTIA